MIEPEHIYIGFWDRTLGNKIARVVYCVIKTFQASVWFYFVPFTVIYLSYYIPYYYATTEELWAKN